MKPAFQCIIITGLSGAGKSVALNAYEDLGITCVDNLPLQLLPKLADLYHESGIDLRRIAVGVDVRLGALLEEFTKSLQDLSRRGISYQIIFLEAQDEALGRRFSETRRRHPLGKTVQGGIEEERKRMKAIRKIADRIVDTTNMTPHQLKNVLSGSAKLTQTRSMAITVTSFGYKYGIPFDADIVLDVRFLPNPNYVRKLKPLTGLTRTVANYVLRNPATKRFIHVTQRLLNLTVPQYRNEGKSYLTLAIGCTGGRHRSVALAEEFGRFLTNKKYPTRVVHRDINL